MTLKTRSGFFGQSRRQKAPHTWTSPWWGGHLYFQDGPLNWHYHTLEEKICWLQVNLHKQEWKGGVPATIQALNKGLPWEGDSYLQKSTTPHQVEVSNKQISPEINCIAVPVLNSRSSTLLCTVINYMWDGLGCKKKSNRKAWTFIYSSSFVSLECLCLLARCSLKDGSGAQQEEGKDDAE